MPLEIVPPEQKMNMSLDDLIKMKKTEKKGKKVNAKPSPATNARKAKKPTNTNNAAGKKVNKPNNSAAKVAASVGASKAKRAATIANRRGLNTTGKASKEDIKKEVKKETKKAATANTGGLKISFKPSELGKTTEKEVAQQIKAVLSRQSGVNSGSSKSIASHTSNESSKPRNPKVQGKNTIRIKR
jgi:hypothetical protein